LSILPDYQTTDFDRLLIDDLKAALAADIVALADSFFGNRTPGSHSLRRDLRYGSKGALKVGSFFDFDSQKGGDVIATVMRGTGLTFRNVLLTYGPQYGIDFSGNGASMSADEEAINARKREQRAAEQARKKAKADAEAAADRKSKIAQANSSWARSSRLGGTLGETYLEQHRCIPKPQQGWPHDLVRFNSFRRSLIVAGTTDDGSIQCIQDVILDGEGKKNAAAKPDKPTTGPRDGAFVRIPGPADKPLLVAEGLETSFSLWRATEYETLACLGGIKHPGAGVAGRHLIICQDDDNPEKDAKLLAMAREWVAPGVRVSIATPWQERRHDRSDFNDVIKVGGVQAVRERIARAIHCVPPEPPKPHFTRPHLSGAAASARLQWVMSAWFDRVERYLDCRDWMIQEAARIEHSVRQELEDRWFRKLVGKNSNDPKKARQRVKRYLDEGGINVTDTVRAENETPLTDKLVREGAVAMNEARIRAAEHAEKSAPAVAKKRARKAAVLKFGKRAVSDGMPRIQIRAAAGTGKTIAFIREYLRRPALWNRHVYFYARTLELADEFEHDLWRFAEEIKLPDDARPKVRVIRGRESRGMCDRDRLKIVKVQSKDLKSIYQITCHTAAMRDIPESFCPAYSQCEKNGWVSQYMDKTPQLRIMTHARMAIHQPTELTLPEPDLVVVDENISGTMAQHTIIDPAVLMDRSIYAKRERPFGVSDFPIEAILETAEQVAKAVSADACSASMLAILREIGVTPEALQTAAAGAQAGYDNATPGVFAGQDAVESKRRLDIFKKHEGAAVASMLCQLAQDVELGRQTSNGVEWDPEHKVRLEDGTMAKHPVIRSHGLNDAVGAPNRVALMILDADARLKINRRIFGNDLREFVIPAVRQSFCIQVSDYAVATGSVTSDTAGRGGKGIKLRGKIAELLKREVANGRQTLIITPKKVRLKLTGEKPNTSIPHYASLSGADITHFGRHLGSNKWSDFDTAIVLREQLPPIEAERMARAIWANDPDVTLALTGKYIKQARHHDLRHGIGPAVEVQVHPDPHVQSIVELYRENAMGQAVDRLRLIHRNPAKPGMVVDRFLKLDDVLDGGTIWDRAFAAMPGGVIPLSKHWLTNNLGELFTSSRLAEREVATLLFGNTATSVIDIYTQLAVLRISNVSYWIAGQKNPSKALVASNVVNPRAELERVLGTAVVRFEGLPEQPARADSVQAIAIVTVDEMDVHAQADTEMLPMVIQGGYGDMLEPATLFPVRPFAALPDEGFTFSRRVLPFGITGSLATTQGAMTLNSGGYIGFTLVHTTIGTVLNEAGLAYMKAREASEAARVASRSRALC
jgi:hypothetical protein